MLKKRLQARGQTLFGQSRCCAGGRRLLQPLAHTLAILLLRSMVANSDPRHRGKADATLSGAAVRSAGDGHTGLMPVKQCQRASISNDCERVG